MDDSMKTMLAVNHSPLFPIHSWCRVPVVQNNDVHDEIALCVLGMNVIFEKLYVFTYFMLLFIIPVSTISAGYYTFLLIFAYFRSSTVADLMGVCFTSIRLLKRCLILVQEIKDTFQPSENFHS